MTLEKFIEWAVALPPEFQEAELASVLNVRPSGLKRVEAIKLDETTPLIVFVPCGASLKEGYEVVDYLKEQNGNSN